MPTKDLNSLGSARVNRIGSIPTSLLDYSYPLLYLNSNFGMKFPLTGGDVTTQNFPSSSVKHFIKSQTHCYYLLAQLGVYLSVLSLVHLRNKCRGLSAEVIAQGNDLKHHCKDFTTNTWDFKVVNSV